MSNAPSFPPLLKGVAVSGGTDPFAKACAMAALGCDGGTVIHNLQADKMRVAMVFAPEVALEAAMAMLPVCALGFQNALGVLAPPEVAVHLTWAGDIMVNGASCGRLQVAAATDDATAVPDWLVVGWQLTIYQTGESPGDNPDVTALYEEGCADVDPLHLLESWSRHTLVWINQWGDAGSAAIHREWMGLLQGVGDPVENAGFSGTFLGVDDQFGMLIRSADTTHLVPMSTLLEGSP